jgi:hypothetical protein
MITKNMRMNISNCRIYKQEKEDENDETNTPEQVEQQNRRL